jgi:hypothetical protein
MPLQAQRRGGGTAQTKSQSNTRRKCVVSTTLHSLYPRKDPVPNVQEDGWALMWPGRHAKSKPPFPLGFDPRTIQHLTSRYTHYAIDMNGSSEYTEHAVADSRQGVVLHLRDWARG